MPPLSHCPCCVMIALMTILLVAMQNCQIMAIRFTRYREPFNSIQPPGFVPSKVDRYETPSVVQTFAPNAGSSSQFATKAGYDSQESGQPSSYSITASTQGSSLAKGPSQSYSYASVAPPRPQEYSQCTFEQDDNCFGRSSACAIKNAMPFERRAMMSLEQCKTCCLGYVTDRFSCQSFVYDSVNQLCDMFAHRGDHPPALLLPTANKNYYEVIGSNCRSSKPISVPATAAPVMIKPLTSVNWKMPKKRVCSPGEAEFYFKVSNRQVASGIGTEISPMTDRQCMKMCSSNKDRNGQLLQCNSFDFYPNEHRCIVYAESDVSGELTLKDGVHHYVKACLPDQEGRCADIILREPQRALIGYSKTVLEIESLEECVGHCLKAPTLYGYSCLSGVFYRQKEILNCILNTETKDQHPDLYIEERQNGVEYFQLNCDGQTASLQTTNILHEMETDGSPGSVTQKPNAIVIAKEIANDWTLWSPCEPYENVRRRYQVCNKMDIRQCPQEQEACAPGTASNIASGRRLADPRMNGIQLSGKDCSHPNCCPVFGSCKVGIQKMANNQLAWCPNPC